MSFIAGIAGASRNAAMALCHEGRVVAACEQERLTRTRRVGLTPWQLPVETLDTLLRLAGGSRGDVARFAVAEEAVLLPDDVEVDRVDHHLAHAAASFFTSPFRDAVVLVCDRHPPYLTAWRGDDSGLTPERLPWHGPAFADVYSHGAEALGFGQTGNAYRLEALARAAMPQDNVAIPSVRLRGDHLDVPAQFQSCIAHLAESAGGDAAARRASLARHIQGHIGQLLLELVDDLRRRCDVGDLCLGGGLFYNSYLNTVVAQSGLYDHTFVPVNPGNAGLAIGAALTVGAPHPTIRNGDGISPFLGPSYDSDEIKAVLDNCKLSYDYLRNGQLIDRTAAALAKDRLVGWFQDRMEWGPRALGNRSILASPVSPYVLENLNVFLKHREPHRSYSVAVCSEDLARYFRGPAASNFMEYEFEVVQPSPLSSLLPPHGATVRVQTVPPSAGVFHSLIKAFGRLTGVPVLVNTSFNGFNEPIVCTPRDAVRVFYGTGLDVAVLGNFLLQK